MNTRALVIGWHAGLAPVYLGGGVGGLAFILLLLGVI